MSRAVAAIVLAVAVAPASARAATPAIQRLSNRGGTATRLGVDARGNAVAIWQAGAPKLGGKPYEQTSALIVSRRRAGGHFDMPRPLTRLDLAVFTFALEVGARGDSAVVWQPAGHGQQLYVHRARPGKALGAGAVLPGSRGGTQPVAAIDARGRLLVAWLRPSRRDRCGMVVMATVAPRGGAFRRPKRLSDACGHAGWLRADLARHGDGAVAWRSSGARSAVSHSVVQISPFAGGHFRPRRAASAVGNVGEALALAAGGRRAVLVWRDKAPGVSRVLTAAIDAGHVGAPVAVMATPDVLLADVGAAMSPRDAAMVAWQHAPKGSSVWDAFATGEVAIRASSDGAFGPPEVVAPEIETAADYGLSGLALDASGRALAGYEDFARIRPLAGPWGRQVALHRHSDYSDPDWPPNGDEISVGLSDAGEGLAVWVLSPPLEDRENTILAAVIPAP